MPNTCPTHHVPLTCPSCAASRRASIITPARQESARRAGRSRRTAEVTALLRWARRRESFTSAEARGRGVEAYHLTRLVARGELRKVEGGYAVQKGMR